MKSIVLLIFFYSVVCQGQDIRSDLKQINRNYYQNPNCLFYKVKILYYDVLDPSDIYDSLAAKYYKQNLNIYMDLDEMEMLLNEEYHIIADNKYKNLLVSKNAIQKPTNYSLDIIDTLIFSNNYSIKLVNVDNSTVEILLSFENSVVMDSAIIKYDKNNYFINELILYYKHSGIFHQEDFEFFKPVIHIHFIEQKFITYQPELFHIDRYVLKQDSQYVGKGKYKNYTVNQN